MELTAEAARAMEASIKRQTKQVFMEGLGNLKDFIKARNPHTLEMAIQAAREEEKIKTSSESKSLYQPVKREQNLIQQPKNQTGRAMYAKNFGIGLEIANLKTQGIQLTNRTHHKKINRILFM